MRVPAWPRSGQDPVSGCRLRLLAVSSHSRKGEGPLGVPFIRALITFILEVSMLMTQSAEKALPPNTTITGSYTVNIPIGGEHRYSDLSMSFYVLLVLAWHITSILKKKSTDTFLPQVLFCCVFF